MDRIGTRKGFAIAISVWSVAAMAHAAAASAFTFGAARALTRTGRGGEFPCLHQDGSRVVPQARARPCNWNFQLGREHRRGDRAAGRALDGRALGLAIRLHCHRRAGIPLADFLARDLSQARGSTLRFRRRNSALIESDPPDRAESYPWLPLLPKRETWAFAIGKGLTDPVWWFYLFWLPKYLQETFGLSLFQAIVPLLVLYNLTTVGSIGGGWLSSTLIDRGWTVNRARKTAMLVCALGVVPVIFAPYCKNLWVVVALVGTALAAHQGWSANLFTTTSDMFPRSAVGSVVGIGGTMGAAASVVLQIATGYIVELTHSYLPLFIFGGCAYLIALGIFQKLSPRLAPAQLD